MKTLLAFVAILLSPVLATAQTTLRFASWQESRFPFAYSTFVVDIDSDGLADVPFTTGVQFIMQYARNMGDGSFAGTTVNYSGYPPLWTSADIGAYFDIDGDKDLDVLIAQGQGFGPRPKIILINQGNRAFVEASPTRLPANDFREAGPSTPIDIDSDGDTDVVVWNRVGPAQLLLNDGRGNFSIDRQFPAISMQATSVDIGDLNRDGYPDIVACGGPATVVYGGPQGQRTKAEPFGRAPKERCSIGDINRDGWLDVALFGFDPGFYMNQGPSGNFVNEKQRAPGAFGSWYGALADFDSDGDLDIVSGNGPTFHWNDGNGNFGAAQNWHYPTPHPPRRVTAIAPADYDGDGDIDVLHDHVYWNLHRHAYTKLEATLGSDIEVELFGRTGSAFVPFLSATRRKLVVPGIGTWFIDPVGAVVLPSRTMTSNTKQLSYKIPVPNNPWLRGQTIYIQHLQFEPGSPQGFYTLQHRRVALQ